MSTVEALEAQIDQQGEKVRALKAAKSPQEVLVGEIQILLSLKEQLPEGGASPAAASLVSPTEGVCVQATH